MTTADAELKGYMQGRSHMKYLVLSHLKYEIQKLDDGGPAYAAFKVGMQQAVDHIVRLYGEDTYLKDYAGKR